MAVVFVVKTGLQKRWRRVLKKSNGEKCCREELDKSVVEKRWKRALEKSVA